MLYKLPQQIERFCGASANAITEINNTYARHEITIITMSVHDLIKATIRSPPAALEDGEAGNRKISNGLEYIHSVTRYFPLKLP